MSFTEEGASCTETYTSLTRAGQNYPMQLLSEPLCSMDVDMESVLVPAKRKVPERCKFWPACKNADGCVFHHPTAPCKSFPKCRFADKCFFIHPNCKYDAKCTKTDCPYTHASRRVPVPPLRTVPVAIPHPDAQVCRFFPACRNTECSFYHPKVRQCYKGGGYWERVSPIRCRTSRCGRFIAVYLAGNASSDSLTALTPGNHTLILNS
ncbi:hypothetical protein FKM82_026932 [Ascaphus truei]